MDNAENGFMYEVRQLEKEYDLSDPSKKGRFISDVASRMLRFEDPVERDSYLQIIAYRYDVSTDSLNEVIRKLALGGAGVTPKEKPLPTRSNRSELSDASLILQARLLSWLCDEPGIFETVNRYITPDDLPDPLYRKVAEILFDRMSRGIFDPADIITSFTEEEEQRRIAEAFHSGIGNLEGETARSAALKDIMVGIKRLSLTRDDRKGNDFDTIRRLRNELAELEKAVIRING